MSTCRNIEDSEVWGPNVFVMQVGTRLSSVTLWLMCPGYMAATESGPMLFTPHLSSVEYPQRALMRRFRQITKLATSSHHAKLSFPIELLLFIQQLSLG